MKNKWVRMTVTLILTAVLMSVGALGAYGAVAKPKYYAQFLDAGERYLEAGAYEQAVLEYNKAIQIERRSTEARVGAGRGYVGAGNTEEAVSVLREAQEIDGRNTGLLQEILDILRDVAPEDAYQILQRYIEIVGESDIAPEIQPIIESADEPPVTPLILPAGDTYVNAIQVQLTTDKLRVGHSIHYTLDGTSPNAKSPVYTGAIPLDADTNVRAVSVSARGEVSEIAEARYSFQPETLSKLRVLYDTTRGEVDAAEVGTAVGNCVEGAKEAAQPALSAAKELLDRDEAGDPLPYTETETARLALNEALYQFRQHIIVQTDRAALTAAVSQAESLLTGAQEGTNAGQYHTGAIAELQGVLTASKMINENLLSRQNQIDTALTALTTALERFQNRRITQQEAEIMRILETAGTASGPVTVSLLWDTIDDVDLHVTSPNGDVISYHNKVGSSGGRLDVDRQVGTYVDHPVENIYWSNPPHGTYTVRVNMFSKRTSGGTDYRVRVFSNGETTIYSGTLASGTDQVCTFTY